MIRGFSNISSWIALKDAENIFQTSNHNNNNIKCEAIKNDILNQLNVLCIKLLWSVRFIHIGKMRLHEKTGDAVKEQRVKK